MGVSRKELADLKNESNEKLKELMKPDPSAVIQEVNGIEYATLKINTASNGMAIQDLMVEDGNLITARIPSRVLCFSCPCPTPSCGHRAIVMTYPYLCVLFTLIHSRYQLCAHYVPPPLPGEHPPGILVFRQVVYPRYCTLPRVCLKR